MNNMNLIFISICLISFHLIKVKTDDILEIYKMENFPKDKIALHLPCEESNVFATKCMCHIQCTDKECSNAKELCRKYSNRGCKYVITRNLGAKRKIATLKRTPTIDELQRFDVEPFKRNQFKAHEVPRGVNKKTLNDFVAHNPIRNEQVLSDLQKSSNKSYCGDVTSDHSNWKQRILNSSISLFALNYRAPLTLLNSLKSWNSTGLLDLMSENIIILNDPYPEEVSMANAFGFEILQPNDVPQAKVTKQNVFTISSAFYQALLRSKNEYILFLENDFKMDTEISLNDMTAELLAGVGLLERGVEVIRMQSRKYKGCGTHKDCDHDGIHLHSNDVMQRTRNWFAFYCKGRVGSEQYVADCLSDPYYRCFTSWDSNWTLNAVLVKKSSMLNKKYNTDEGTKSIGDLSHDCHQRQDCLETKMMFNLKWMNWRVPICISYQGMFIHERIETQ